MAPKAVKKIRGQEAGEKEKLTEIEKEFFNLQIGDANKKIERLKSRNQELEDELDETKKALQKLDEERADIIAYLKRMVKAKADEIVEIQERLAAVQQARETERKMFAEKIHNMENDFKMMHEQLTAEIKLLNGKLNALEEFRSQREELMNKYLAQEAYIAEKEEQHKQQLYEVERKFIIAKDELKKDMVNKLLELSLDFQHASQMRIAATTQRVIRENVAVNNELADLMESWKQLTDDVTSFKEKNQKMKKEIESHKSESFDLLKKNGIQAKIIDKISVEYQRVLEIYSKIKNYEKQTEALQEQVNDYQKKIDAAQEKTQKAEQLLHYYETDLAESKLKIVTVEKEVNRLQNIITQATSAVMDCTILDQLTDHSAVIGRRETLMRTLLELFSIVEDTAQKDKLEVPVGESLDTVLNMKGSYIYKVGDLGIIPKQSVGSSTSQRGSTKPYRGNTYRGSRGSTASGSTLPRGSESSYEKGSHN